MSDYLLSVFFVGRRPVLAWMRTEKDARALGTMIAEALQVNGSHSVTHLRIEKRLPNLSMRLLVQYGPKEGGGT